MAQVQFIITLDPETGQLGVQAPIQNMILCYGMLEMAKAQLPKMQEQAQQRIQPVGAGVVLPPPPGR